MSGPVFAAIAGQLANAQPEWVESWKRGVADGLAQHIRVVDGANALSPGELGVAVTGHIIGELEAVGLRLPSFDAREIIDAVIALRAPGPIGAAALADAIVERFGPA